MHFGLIYLTFFILFLKLESSKGGFERTEIKNNAIGVKMIRNKKGIKRIIRSGVRSANPSDIGGEPSERHQSTV